MEFDVENFVTEAIKQVPGLAVMLVMVVKFLSHLRGRDESLAQNHKETASALDRNTMAFGEVRECMRSVTSAIEKCKRNSED